MKKLLLFPLIVLVFAACSSKNPEKKFLDEVGSLSKEQILARGDALFEKKKYEDARKYYSFLSDSFPNDPLGRRAALKVADTFYMRRDIESLTEAQLRYKDFANRFPSDPARAYALLMLGKCSFQQGRGPLRDLAPVREAAASFRQVVELFPDSSHAPEARELLVKCNETLGAHEFDIAQYYYNIGRWGGARQRLEYLLTTYAGTGAAVRGQELLAKMDAKTPTPAERPAEPAQTPTATPKAR